MTTEVLEQPKFNIEFDQQYSCLYLSVGPHKLDLYRINCMAPIVILFRARFWYALSFPYASPKEKKNFSETIIQFLTSNKEAIDREVVRMDMRKYIELKRLASDLLSEIEHCKP